MSEQALSEWSISERPAADALSRLLARLQADEAVFNGWLHLPGGVSAEVMGHAGYDALTVDLQHGLIGDGGLVSSLQAIAATPAAAAGAGALAASAGSDAGAGRRGRRRHLPDDRHAAASGGPGERLPLRAVGSAAASAPPAPSWLTATPTPNAPTPTPWCSP